jgi:hypothetical protein
MARVQDLGFLKNSQNSKSQPIFSQNYSSSGILSSGNLGLFSIFNNLLPQFTPVTAAFPKKHCSAGPISFFFFRCLLGGDREPGSVFLKTWFGKKFKKNKLFLVKLYGGLYRKVLIKYVLTKKNQELFFENLQ